MSDCPAIGGHLPDGRTPIRCLLVGEHDEHVAHVRWSDAPPASPDPAESVVRSRGDMTESADNRKISRLLSYTCGVCGLPLHLVFESFTKPVRWEHPEGTGGHPVELVRHEHEVDLDELPAPDKWAPGV